MLTTEQIKSKTGYLYGRAVRGGSRAEMLYRAERFIDAYGARNETWAISLLADIKSHLATRS